MTNLNEIKAAVEHLPDNEYKTFLEWVHELEHDRWERQICKDYDEGKLDKYIERASKDYEEGKCTKI